MSGKKSRNKGAKGELEWRDVLRSNYGCTDAERGAQRHGGPESPDVRHGIPGTHAEVKRCEKLSLYAAVEQAVEDAGSDVPYVAHRRNHKEWLVIVRECDLIEFCRAVMEGTET